MFNAIIFDICVTYYNSLSKQIGVDSLLKQALAITVSLLHSQN